MQERGRPGHGGAAGFSEWSPRIDQTVWSSHSHLQNRRYTHHTYQRRMWEMKLYAVYGGHTYEPAETFDLTGSEVNTTHTSTIGPLS